MEEHVMTQLRTAFARLGTLTILCVPASAQVVRYGSPTPSGFGVELTNGTLQSYAGNSRFELRLTGSNAYGGALFMALSRASIPFGPWTLLLDPLTLQANAFPLSPGALSQAMPLPRDPTTYGLPVDFQALLLTNGGIDVGATNGVEVRIQRFRTPTRGYFPGANYEQGLISPGQFSTLDLSIWPPQFRATSDVGYNGLAGQNFPVAVAVSDRLDYAFLHGNDYVNPFIRVLDISTDPTGVVTYASLGDIPLARGPHYELTYSDIELSRDGRWLFCTTGSDPVELLVFDLSGLPGTLPTAAVQSLTFAGVSPGTAVLDASPDDRLLALCLSSSPSADVILYDITAAPQPLVMRASLDVTGADLAGAPSAIDFSLDSRRLFVVTSGTYSYYDVSANPPVALLSNAPWTSRGSPLYPRNGGTLAVRNGQTVAVAAEEGWNAFYSLIDLAEPPGPTFGTVVQRFSTNPLINIPGGDISSTRLQALGSIVVAVDGVGGMSDGRWIDVFDLDATDPVTGFRAARLRIPSPGNLSLASWNCLPREFDLR
jgi:hypothetical protein